MDVFFDTQRGKSFSIEVGYFDTVLEIKHKIEKYQGIPVSKQTLIFNGKVLEDDLDVERCVILHNSRVQLVLPSNHSSNFDNVSIKKQDHRTNPNNFRMPSSASGAHALEVAANVGSGAGGGKRLRVMVATMCGTRKIPVEVNAGDSVGELRKELSKLRQRLNFSLPQEGYFFIYKQNVMDDDRSFRWHHVCQGDTIEIFNGSVSGGS